MLHAAYTYSHSIDMERDNLFGGASASIVPNAYNVKGTNRGSSDFDFRHWFAFTYVYDIPDLRSATGALRHILRGWRITVLAGDPRIMHGAPVGGHSPDRAAGCAAYSGSNGRVPGAAECLLRRRARRCLATRVWRAAYA